jgi:ADP-ribosylation factor-like protein 6
MSSFFTKLLFNLGFIKKKVSILIVGLDNAGKSTILNQIKLLPNNGDKTSPGETVPTIGFNVDTFTKDRLQWTVFDMSGQSKYRTLWEHYYSEVNGIIFVIDSTDRVRGVVAREELDSMLNHQQVKARSCPILILANKNDIQGGMTESECSDALGLENIKDRAWYIG